MEDLMTKGFITAIIIILIMGGITVNALVKEKKSCYATAKALKCECNYTILHGCKLKCKPTGSLFLDAIKERYNGR